MLGSFLLLLVVVLVGGIMYLSLALKKERHPSLLEVRSVMKEVALKGTVYYVAPLDHPQGYSYEIRGCVPHNGAKYTCIYSFCSEISRTHVSREFSEQIVAHLPFRRPLQLEFYNGTPVGILHTESETSVDYGASLDIMRFVRSTIQHDKLLRSTGFKPQRE